MIVPKLWFSMKIQITCVYRCGTAWLAHGLAALTAAVDAGTSAVGLAEDAPAAGRPDRHPHTSATAPELTASLINLAHITLLLDCCSRFTDLAELSAATYGGQRGPARPPSLRAEPDRPRPAA